MLVLAFNINPVKADVQAVYINADGSIAPVGAPIVTSDKMTYNFTGNIIYPTYYGVIVQRSNIVIDGHGHTVQGNQSGNGLYLAGISNVTLKNTNVKGFVYGIYLSSSSNCTVIGNNAMSNFFSGILIYSSSYSEVVGNVATANGEAGIYLTASSNNKVTGNIVAANTLAGIALYSSSSNTISGNNATANIQVGIFLAYASNNTVVGNTATANGYDGIYLYSSSNNTFSGNAATANSWDGIYLYSSSNNTIVGNNVTANGWGIYLVSSNASSFFHNNFVGNTIQAYVGSSCVGNVWDNGYPSGGNYWSNYTGFDQKRGPSQDQPGSDGIGDTNHTIDANNQDGYPLTKPYSGPHDIGITALAASKTVVGQGYNIDISGKIINYGEQTETFSVTIKANSTTIQTQTITLTTRNSTIIGFNWNTSGFVKGNYTISAYAWPVPDETDTSDNSFTGGWVIVSMVGDLCGTGNAWDFVPDGVVDGSDLSIVAKCYGSWPGAQPPMIWNANCDVNNDGVVDGSDLAIIAKHFGESNP